MSLASGTLPPGLTLGTAGDLVGSPTTAGNYAFHIDAADSLGLYPQTNTGTGLPVSGGGHDQLLIPVRLGM